LTLASPQAPNKPALRRLSRVAERETNHAEVPPMTPPARTEVLTPQAREAAPPPGRDPVDSGQDAMNKFFIVGCPRSGTTMVQQALNRHSCVAIPPETKFFFSFFGQSRKAQAHHLERLKADLNIELPLPATRIWSLDEGRAFYRSLASRYIAHLGKKTATWFGEKTPEHTGHLPTMRAMFPEAKFIILYRDGRDVALSLTKVPWMSKDLYVNFVVWLYYSWIVDEERSNPGPNVLFARYEDVVASPEEQLRRMLHFLGLPYEPAVALGWGNPEGIPQREYAWKARALGKITPERVGVFRRELTAEQIAILERLGKHPLLSLGYDLLGDGNGSLSAGFFMHLSLRLGQLLYRLPWNAVAKEVLARSCSAAWPGRLVRSLAATLA
jgi:hypothetical protein